MKVVKVSDKLLNKFQLIRLCFYSGSPESSGFEGSVSAFSNDVVGSVRVSKRVKSMGLVQLLEVLEVFEHGLLFPLVFLDFVPKVIELELILADDLLSER